MPLSEQFTVHDFGEFKDRSTLLEHAVRIDSRWWAKELSASGFSEVAKAFTNDRLSRQDLFDKVPGTDDIYVNIEFAAKVLAWGSGMKNRNNRRRIRSLADPLNQKLLIEAIAASKRGDKKAFELFQANGRNTIPYLGPAFFTKIMYFAGGGAKEHPLLIVDQRVLRTLRNRGITRDEISLVANYGPRTYQNSCDALRQIAQVAQRILNVEFSGDMAELWAFQHGQAR